MLLQTLAVEQRPPLDPVAPPDVVLVLLPPPPQPPGPPVPPGPPPPGPPPLGTMPGTLIVMSCIITPVFELNL